VSAALDVNTLLYASDQRSPFHERAVQFVAARAASRDVLCLAWPTVMGYLRMATHPGIFSHPLTAADAMRNMTALVSLSHVRLIAEEDGFWDVYQDVLRNWPARGNQVPDAHLAALLRQHGVGTLYTGDADFRRFDFLRIINPFA
jgi:toxin-antitoxin system PIN domain toxin